MPSRREFLGTGAIVALGAATSRPLAAEPPASQQQAPALPPAIAALSSQKDRMVPITNDERRTRIEQARRLMGNQGLDAIVLTGGTSLRYFTNMSWGLSERLLAVILPREGAPFVGQKKRRTHSCPPTQTTAQLDLLCANPVGATVFQHKLRFES